MLQLITKPFAFIKRYRKHPLYMLVYVLGFFQKNFASHIYFYTDEELVELLKEGKTIIRLGDGDIVSIQLDLENCYHISDKRLKDMYATLIREYKNGSPYILSVPVFVNTKNTDLKKLGKGKLQWGMAMKTMFFLKFNKDVPYMDAHNFYYDNYFEGKIAPLFIDKQVVFITNRNTIEKQKNNPNMPWKNAIYVESPFVDAMNSYEAIKKDLDQKISQYNKKDIVIFAAMGPVGKYILYEYAEKGYQGIDIGKVCEVMFTGESIQYMV